MKKNAGVVIEMFLQEFFQNAVTTYCMNSTTIDVYTYKRMYACMNVF